MPMPFESTDLNVTDIDYDQIKSNLINYLKSQDTLKDYDFEGSAIQSLLSVMAYVTHINAINVNIGLNEAFLHSAQFRGSVSSHARLLSYTPQSAHAASATLNISLFPKPTEPEDFIIPRGTAFTSGSGGQNFTFRTFEDYYSNDGLFTNVRIYEGKFSKIEFIYDKNTSEKFLIPAKSIDTRSLKVIIYKSAKERHIYVPFVEATTLTEIKPNSMVYFLHENPDGLFELTFGDNVVGQQLADGNVIEIEYLITAHEAANEARLFTSATTIKGRTFQIKTIEAATGGTPAESIQSIKHAAPITFGAQNRSVTSTDYEAIIRSQFSNVETIRIWGGEDNDPPVYGKVFLSIKPKTGLFLTTSEKEFIYQQVLKPKSVVTIKPEFVDPDYVFIIPQVFFRYDKSRLKQRSILELETIVKRRITDFQNAHLNRFDSVFRYSNFLHVIDTSDVAVVNSTVRIFIQKFFAPTLFVKNDYILEFSNKLYRVANRPVIQHCTRFSIQGFNNCTLLDFDNRIHIVNAETDDVLIRDIGYIDDSRIVLKDFNPESFVNEGGLYITALADSYDLVGTKNNILTINKNNDFYKVQGSEDSILTGQDYTGRTYKHSIVPRYGTN